MYNTKNLIKLRDWLLTNEKRVRSHLDMRYYCYLSAGYETGKIRDQLNDSNPCETDCCLLGFAVESGLFSNDCESYRKFSWLTFFSPENETEQEILFEENPNYCYNEWRFLFDMDWSNDFEEAIGRLNYAIEHGTCPPNWYYSDSFKEYGKTLCTT